MLVHNSEETNSKVIVVSGGSRGLGAAIVSDLLAQGYRVATFSRSTSALVTERQNSDPDRRAFLWSELDAVDREGVVAFVRDVRRHFRRIDGLVNCAGVAPEG